MSFDKRKWQIALRRYVFENKPSSYYAAYFGISSELFKEWILSQLNNRFNWDDFGKTWQLEHFVPSMYFDLASEDDLKLYWHFTNIRVVFGVNENSNLFSALNYFSKIFEITELEMTGKMVKKIEELLNSSTLNKSSEQFLKNQSKRLKDESVLSSVELQRLNAGESISELFAERELLKRFG